VAYRIISTPFPYHGSKKRVAKEIWRRFGDPAYFVEPFGGSCQCLLRRPTRPQHEIVGDVDGHISNFFRAAKWAPEQMARHCWFIPSEVDLFARHAELMKRRDDLERKLRADPCYFDAELGAWWAWGISLWIGTGWCQKLSAQRPQLGGYRGVHNKRPHITSRRGLANKRPHVDRPRGVKNQVESAGDYLDELRARVETGKRSDWQQGLLQYFTALAFRLERVTLFHGDWRKCVSDGVLNRSVNRLGQQAILLDPPYREDCCQSAKIYAHGGVWDSVVDFCREYGERCDLRIALCGYEGTADLEKYSWQVYSWVNSAGARGKRDCERIWFSPACENF
jgi:hypothetical protein